MILNTCVLVYICTDTHARCIPHGVRRRSSHFKQSAGGRVKIVFSGGAVTCFLVLRLFFCKSRLHMSKVSFLFRKVGQANKKWGK